MAKIGNLQGLSDLAKASMGRKSKKEVITVKLDEVEPKEQVRKKFKNIEELAETMRVEGQQSPIIVYPKNENGKYIIQKGERRWRALRLAEIETIDIIVNDKKLSKLDEVAGELIENIQRDDLAPLEIANALKKFIDDGWKQKDVAKRLGKSPIFVSTHLSLLKLPECARELYDKEVCSDTETLNNLRLLHDLNPDRCRAVCAVALEEGITRKQSRDLLNDAKRIKEEMETDLKTATQLSTESMAKTVSNSENLINSNEVDTEEEAVVENKSKQKSKVEKTNQDGNPDGKLPAPPEDNGWKFTEPNKLIVAVNVPTDTDVKRGILLLDRVCENPKEVWVKVAYGKKEKQIRVLASEIELVSIEA